MVYPSQKVAMRCRGVTIGTGRLLGEEEQRTKANTTSRAKPVFQVLWTLVHKEAPLLIATPCAPEEIPRFHGATGARSAGCEVGGGRSPVGKKCREQI